MVRYSSMFDYHLHTSLCGHAEGTVSEYVATAVKIGFREICFTDHIPLPGDYDAHHRMAMDEMEIYLEEIERARKMYPEIEILTGIEADYIEGFEGFIEEFLGKYPFDIVLMSIHFVSGWPEGHWVFGYQFPEKTIEQIYREYFQSMKQGIATGLFDVVAHFDLIKKTGHPVLETNRRDVEEVLRAVKDAGMCVEINTSGIHKSIAEPYPSPGLAGMIIEHGIPITTGSDAHLPERVGLHFDRVAELLSAYPDGKLARFRRRQYEIQSFSADG